MLKNAQALVKAHDMLPPGATVLCAVSGGADSMCLLHWLSQQEGLTLHAAHFNHRLRPGESDRDAAFVRDWCGAKAIPFHLGSGDVAGRAKELGQGVEETAREMRYAFLDETAQEVGAHRIAVAHNADDNIETVLMHLLRGTGLQGLGGMAPRRGELVRPLLTTPRCEVKAYLERFELPHVEDSSNQNDDFLRNKVRHQLVPLLEELAPGFGARLTAAIPRLRREEDYLNAQARQAADEAHWEEEDKLVIPAGAIADLPDPLAVRAVRQLLGMTANGSTDCAGAHLEGLVALCRSQDPSAALHLPHGLTARREYENLTLSGPGDAPFFVPFIPRQGDNPVPGTAWTVHLSVPPWPGLVIRPRRTGDETRLPGGHTRSLKKLFIDRKIPRRLRDSFPVAADPDGVIFAAPFGPNLAHPHYKDIQITQTEEDMA